MHFPENDPIFLPHQQFSNTFSGNRSIFTRHVQKSQLLHFGKIGVIQNNIDTKRRNKDSKADIGPKAGEDTFINKKRPTLLFW